MIPNGDKYKPKRDPLRLLSWQVVLSKWAILWENAARAFWPLASLVLVFYAFAAFDGFGLLSPRAAQILLGLLALAAIVLFYWGARRFSIPTRKQALARLDLDLDNKPIAALQDQPALKSKDPITIALWQEHQSRMAAAITDARTRPPESELPQRDPNGLRLMALILAMAALIFAPRPDMDDFVAIATANDSVPAPAIFAIEAWATPPAYTGKPALYLTEIDQDTALDLPENSSITLRFYGDADFALSETVSGDATVLAEPEPDATLLEADFIARNAGEIVIKNGDEILGRWQIATIADAAPILRLPDGVEKSDEGALQVTYTARDDYGIESAKLLITPDLSLVDRRYGLEADPILPAPFERDLPMPFSNDRTDIKETFTEDFSDHFWANLPVIISVEVTDGAGQTASLVLDPADLPARSFFDPLAAAFAEQRRDLLWSPENDPRVSRVLRAMTYKTTDGLFPSSSSYLMSRSTIRRLGYYLENGMNKVERDEITDMLWLLANLIEDGDLSSAEARLRRAQERLARALEEGATESEMAELMDELRDATDDYMRQLAENAEPGEAPSPNENTRTMSMDQLQEMLDKLQELTENGQTEEARQMLEQLQEFMENMQVTTQQPQQGQGGEQQQQLQDSLEQQQQLSDEAFQQLQEQLEQGGEQDGGSLAERQEALRQFMEDMQGQEGSDSMEDAERNMGEARDRLEEGDFSGALDEQAEVMENLRQGLRDIQERAQAEQAGEDGQQDNESPQRDPLGRPVGSQGRIDNGETIVPDQSDADRARELLDEIRRRSGDTERPVEELDYLKRLLERF